MSVCVCVVVVFFKIYINSTIFEFPDDLDNVC